MTAAAEAGEAPARRRPRRFAVGRSGGVGAGGQGAGGRFLIPFGAGVLLLVVIPAALSLQVAFTDATGLSPARFNGLANLRRALADPFLRAALSATAIHVAIALPLRLLAATAFGLLLAAPRRGGRWYRMGAYLPTVMPDLALALFALWLFNPLSGPVNRVLGAVGLPEPNWLGTVWGARFAVIAMLLLPIGEAFLVVLASRRQIPASLYEAAALSGHGPLGQLRTVTLPLLTPILALLAIRDVVVLLQQSFIPAYLLTDGRPANATLYLPLYIFDQAFEFSGLGYGAFLTLGLLLLTVATVGGGLLLARRAARPG